MDRTLTAGTQQIIVPVTAEAPRNGEGSVVLLRDGRLLIVYSRFTGGGGDADTADLYGGYLNLETAEVEEPRVFMPSPDALNQMSVSLERLQDSSIAMVYIRKTSPHDDEILFTRSEDEGLTWSAPVHVGDGHGIHYTVVNNDRIRQSPSGRILIPGALYAAEGYSQSKLGVFYSDDNGATWSLGQRVVEDPADVILPKRLTPAGEKLWPECTSPLNKLQEPGVEPLPDGRLLLYCRNSLGYMYQAYSTDDGETWGPLKAAPDLVSPISPQSIRRVPGTDRLICFYNSHDHMDFQQKEPMSWHERTPLTLAVSDDNSESWQQLGTIEDDSHNYCYTSILFVDDQIVLTYYQSENGVKDGKAYRRNLADLKLQILPLQLVTA